MPVAIRAITRLQDADDLNVSLGAGVDEYALVWDNDTAKFVLRAPFAGLLATGATTGATSQAQVFTNGAALGAAGNDGRLTIKSKDATMDLKLYTAYETLNGEIDNIVGLVYNWGSATTVQDINHPRWGLAFEHNYKTLGGDIWDEFYLMHDDLTADPNVSIRPFMTVVNRATNTAVHAMNGSWVNFSQSDGTDTLVAFNSLDGLVHIYPGKAFYLEETAVLGIGVQPNTSGSPLQIARAADGEMATFLRDTVLTQITCVAGNSTTGNSVIGTFSNHPFYIYGAGNAVAKAGTDAKFYVEQELVVSGNGMTISHPGDYSNTPAIINIKNHYLPTYNSQIMASSASGGDPSNSFLRFDLNTGVANTRAATMKLDGNKRVYLSTPATAPTDADLFAGSISFHLDESAHKLHVRVKYANGTTLKAGEVVLT